MNETLAATLPALRQRWQALGVRERRLLLLAALLLGVFVLWSVAVQPAWQIIRSAPAQLEGLEAELQAMQRLATEAKQLRALPPVPPAQAAAAVKLASERLGDKARLNVQGDRAVVTFSGIGPKALREFLQEVRSNARARPIEATLTRASAGYTGTVVLGLGSGG